MFVRQPGYGNSQSRDRRQQRRLSQNLSYPARYKSCLRWDNNILTPLSHLSNDLGFFTSTLKREVEQIVT